MPLLRISPSTTRLRLLTPRLHREEGSALLEFAFSFGIFVAATVGIMILCIALFTYEYVDFASSEAARWASVRGNKCVDMPNCNADSTAIQTYVQGLNYPIVNPSNLKVTATWSSVTYDSNNVATWTACASQCNSPGNDVQVTVTYPYNLDIPFAGDHALNISSTSTLVISQ